MTGDAVSTWTSGDAVFGTQLAYRGEAKWLRGKTTHRCLERSLIRGPHPYQPLAKCQRTCRCFHLHLEESLVSGAEMKHPC